MSAAIAQTIRAAIEAEPGVWSVASLAVDLNVSRNAIHRALLRLLADGVDLSAVRPDRPKAGDHDRRMGLARRMYTEGSSISTIAAALRVTEPTVQDYLGDLLTRRDTHTDRILALLGSVPRKALTTAEVAAHVGCSDRWVRQVVATRRLGRYVRRSAWDVAA